MKGFGKFFLGGALLAVVGLAPVAQAAGPYQFYAVSPCRAVDTRNQADDVNSGKILATQPNRTFTMKGQCGIPATAVAVSLNVTVTGGPGTTLDGHFRLYPAGGSLPTVSTINWAVGETGLANGAIVPLGAAATDDLAVFLGTGYASGYAHVILDVTGYFQ